MAIRLSASAIRILLSVRAGKAGVGFDTCQPPDNCLANTAVTTSRYAH
jgi:hypothetical protein